VRKRKPFASTVVLLLFFTAFVAATSIKLVQANPNPFQTHRVYAGYVAAPRGVKPPQISLLSPINQSCHSTNNIAFSVNVSFSGKSLWYTTIYGLDKTVRVPINSYLRAVYFEADWLESSISTDPNQTINLKLNGIPEGKHNMVVYAVGWSPNRILYTKSYGLGKLLYYNGYNITSCLSITFTIDTIPPQTSILSLQNVTYSTVDVPLNFTVNEAVSEIAYSLDGQENVTITGNTTLTDLSYGDHNVTVYATDMCGHVGASETIYFTITEPFPTASVTAASVASVAVVSMVLLVYFKKRKRCGT